MPPEFSLTTDSIDDQRHVVAVSGEIDLFTAPELKSALGEALAQMVLGEAPSVDLAPFGFARFAGLKP